MNHTYVKILKEVMDITNGRGYVYSIQYPMVWCVKYRYKILEGQVETRLIEILQQIASDNGFQIVEINTEKDHIHLPNIVLHNIIYQIGGKHGKEFWLDFS